MARLSVLCATAIFVGFAVGATAQTIEGRHWQGATAVTRQPEQVVAMSVAEWRSRSISSFTVESFSM